MADNNNVTRQTTIAPGVMDIDFAEVDGLTIQVPEPATKLDVASAGEQHMGFVLSEQRYFFVNGPSGKNGHPANAPGEDGLAFRPSPESLLILDNKSLSRSGNVSAADAIDPSRNLLQNLKVRIERVRTMSDLPHQARILELLERTYAAVENRKPLPGGVRLIVTNGFGNSTGVGRRLRDLGVEFIDLGVEPRLPQMRINLLPGGRMPGRGALPRPNPAMPRSSIALRVGGAAALTLLAAHGLIEPVSNAGIQHAMNQAVQGNLKARIAAAHARRQGVLVIARVQWYAGPMAERIPVPQLLSIDMEIGQTAEDALWRYQNRPPEYRIGASPQHAEGIRTLWLPAPFDASGGTRP